ncbi:MAG: flagellar motor protein MotB [Bdellovibrionota bacterium]
MEEEEECQCSSELWLMSYADLMTLLFAAFVVLYGITPQGQSDKILGVISSIREAFIEIPDDIPQDQLRDGPIIVGKAAYKYFKGETINPPKIKIYKRAQKAVNIINKDMERAKSIIELRSQDGKMSLNPGADQKDITVIADTNGFRLRLVASQFYKPGSYRIDRRTVKRLETVANFLKSLNKKVTIEGHTDSVPPKGEMTNLELSSMRAAHLAQYFIKIFGFPKENISVAGFGEMKPISSNETSAGRALNRRIEIKVHYDEN